MVLLDYNGNGVWDGPSLDRLYALGQAGDVPLVGDWNGDGRHEVGFFRAGMWLLDYSGNGTWEGPATDRLYALGQAGDTPLVGDWNGDNRAKVGLFRNGMWLLDHNGNGVWDGPSLDRLYALGRAGNRSAALAWAVRRHPAGGSLVTGASLPETEGSSQRLGACPISRPKSRSR